MKKKIVSVIGVIVVILIVIFSVTYLRGGNTGVLSSQEKKEQEQKMSKEREEMASTLGQQGEADETSKAFAAKLKEKTRQDIDPRNIVSTGKPLISGKFSYTVNFWKVSKEYPGYEPPEGVDLKAWPGAEVDQNGNIMNDFSYVTVDISVENLKDEETSEYVWGNIRLQIFDAGEYSGEHTYLGRNEEREYGHDYGKEDFSANGTKNAVMIFVVKDKYLTDQEMYLKIDPSGSATVDPDYDVRRFIILN